MFTASKVKTLNKKEKQLDQHEPGTILYQLAHPTCTHKALSSTNCNMPLRPLCYIHTAILALNSEGSHQMQCRNTKTATQLKESVKAISFCQFNLKNMPIFHQKPAQCSLNKKPYTHRHRYIKPYTNCLKLTQITIPNTADYPRLFASRRIK